MPNAAKVISKIYKQVSKTSSESLGMKKPMTTGMRKVQKKIIKNDQKGGRIIGSPIMSTSTKKYKVVEYMTGKPVKGKAKDVMNTARDVERKAGVVKKVSPLRYATSEQKGKKIVTSKPTTPKVPVKKKAK